MKVSLFNPPVHYYDGMHYRMNPALGLPILAAVLEKAGHEAHVWDLEALLIDPPTLAAQFDEQRDRWPDVVGFTVTTHNQRGARECIEALRDVGYDGYIMLGGPHITLLASATIDNQIAWGADAWVTGECEGNIVEIVEQTPAGLVQGEAAPIESIPSPAWHLHTPALRSYMGNLPKVGHPEGIAMWSRGCPHNCIFCGNPVFGHQRIRMRTPQAIYDDMAALKAQGVKAVFVYDDELIGMGGAQNEWLLEVCEKIKPLGLRWKCQGRCSEKAVKPEVLGAMYDAGCRAIMWGVESFSEKVLKAIQKGTTEVDIWHTLRAAHEAGIGNWLFLMVGNYKETALDLAHTETQIRQAVSEDLVQWRQVTICTPVPGTKLYELAEAEGWLVEPPESGPQMAQAYNDTPWLSKRELKYWKSRLEGAS